MKFQGEQYNKGSIYMDILITQERDVKHIID